MATDARTAARYTRGHIRAALEDVARAKDAAAELDAVRGPAVMQRLAAIEVELRETHHMLVTGARRTSTPIVAKLEGLHAALVDSMRPSQAAALERLRDTLGTRARKPGPHHGPLPHHASCEGCHRAGACNNCGETVNASTRCTNGRCQRCCAARCGHPKTM